MTTWQQVFIAVAVGGGVVLLVGAVTRVRVPGQLAAGWAAQALVWNWFGALGWSAIALTLAAISSWVGVADLARDRADR